MSRFVFLVVVITLSLAGVAWASGVRSQNLKSVIVSVDREKAQLKEVLADLKAASSFTFVYSEALGNRGGITIRAKNQTLYDVLNRLAREHQLTFSPNRSLIAVAAARPQQRPGRIGGKVTGAQGETLVGASIKILEGGNATQTSVDGSYVLPLPVGTYTVEVSYVGYQTKRITDVKVEAGETTPLPVSLIQATATLEAATVTAGYKRASVEGLYAQQKNAASVTDGISAQQISRTPDNDMGQVLKRISGLTTVNNKSVVVRGMSDRYNQAMLDGIVIPSTSMNRRDFSFDIIPTEMVSNVVVNKTATPDVSSEFSGGQVSINTLDIPTENFTLISLGTGGNSQTTGNDFYRLGKRHTSEYFGFFDRSAEQPEGLLPWYWHNRATQLDAPPGMVLDDPELNDAILSFDRPDLKYNDLDAMAQSRRLDHRPLMLQRYTGKPNANVRVAIGRVYTLKNDLRFGFAASGSLRNEQNIVHFNNVRGSNYGVSYMDSTEYGHNGAGKSYRFNSSSGLVGNLGLQGRRFKLASKNMYARTYSDNYNEAVRLDYRDITHGIRKEVYQLPEAMSLQQHQLTGEYLLPWSIKFEGMLTYNKIGQQILDERKFQYRLSAILGGEYFFQEPNLLRHSSWSNNTVALDSRMWTHIDEEDYNWAANFSRTFGTGSAVSTVLKAGYQAWTKKRSLDVFRMLPMTRSAAAGEILPNIEEPYEVLLAPENIGSGTGQAYYYAENIGGRIFTGDMNSHALYAMADQKFWDKLRLVYGVRVEYYDLSNRQAELLRSRYGNEIPDYLKFQEESGEKDWRWLPSINATYNLSNTVNIRASYSKTAIRPDFRETSFFGFYDYELDANVSGQDVVSTLVDNTDLRLEWYPSPGEIISLTGYYKYLDKPIELVNNPSFEDGSYYVFANMESAKNYGLEMEMRKNLSWVADKSWLADLFVYANGTLLWSKVNYEGPWEFRTVESGVIERFKERVPGLDRPLIGQSPWLLNLGLGYWGDRFGATASYNHRGYRSHLIRKDPRDIEFELAPRQLDLQVYARFLKRKAEIKLNVANLLDEWTRYYVNTYGYEQADSQSGGLSYNRAKGDNGYSKADGDLIMYRRQEGRRFSLSLTYNF